jgi:hypothetical protein
MAINLQGKIIPDGALLRALEVYGWHHVDGVPHADNEVAAQALIDGYSLEDYKTHRKGESLVIAKALRDQVVAAISPGEMASWSIKRAEAIAYAQSGNPADAPMLSAEAAVRGITLPAMLVKVQANASSFAAAEAAIGGADGKHRDAIAALTTWEAVRDYDLTAGWPAV